MKRFKRCLSITMMAMMLIVVVSCLNLKKSVFEPKLGISTTTTSPPMDTVKIREPGVGTLNATDHKVGPFPGGDWSSRIAWEAGHALSNNNNGTSRFPGPNGTYFGDYNYAGTDQTAFNAVMRESGNQYGIFWPGSSYGVYVHEGTCTWFVREVLYRATYWAGYGWHVTTPGYPSGVWSWTNPCCMNQNYSLAKPGWVLSSPNYHMAIAYQRGTYSGQVGWWVIDSNWVGPSGTELIGKHFMSDATLLSRNFWAWCPTLATTN